MVYQTLQAQSCRVMFRWLHLLMVSIRCKEEILVGVAGTAFFDLVTQNAVSTHLSDAF